MTFLDQLLPERARRRQIDAIAAALALVELPGETRTLQGVVDERTVQLQLTQREIRVTVTFSAPLLERQIDIRQVAEREHAEQWRESWLDDRGIYFVDAGNADAGAEAVKAVPPALRDALLAHRRERLRCSGDCLILPLAPDRASEDVASSVRDLVAVAKALESAVAAEG